MLLMSGDLVALRSASFHPSSFLQLLLSVLSQCSERVGPKINDLAVIDVEQAEICRKTSRKAGLQTHEVCGMRGERIPHILASPA